MCSVPSASSEVHADEGSGHHHRGQLVGSGVAAFRHHGPVRASTRWAPGGDPGRSTSLLTTSGTRNG